MKVVYNPSSADQWKTTAVCGECCAVLIVELEDVKLVQAPTPSAVFRSTHTVIAADCCRCDHRVFEVEPECAPVKLLQQLTEREVLKAANVQAAERWQPVESEPVKKLVLSELPGWFVPTCTMLRHGVSETPDVECGKSASWMYLKDTKHVICDDCYKVLDVDIKVEYRKLPMRFE